MSQSTTEYNFLRSVKYFAAVIETNLFWKILYYVSRYFTLDSNYFSECDKDYNISEIRSTIDCVWVSNFLTMKPSVNI